MAFPAKNYTLGRGRLYFDKFAAGTKNPTGQRYIGNTPEINLTSDSESLEHFDSDNGIRQKDASVLLQLSRTGSFITDHISPANLALFFLGSEEIVTVAPVTDATYDIDDVIVGMRYQVGASSGAPAGVRNLSGVSIVKGVTPLVLDTDFTLDAASGGVTFIAGGAVATGDDVVVTYDLAASSHNRVVTAASAEIEGALLYVSNNPEGEQFDYFWPDVMLKPDGDFALKSDEWQQIGFGFEALKKDDNTEVLYINGRADAGI
jgi:hypothetical protein